MLARAHLPRWRRASFALAFAALPLAIAPFAPTARACSMCQCGDPTYRLLGDNLFGDRSWRTSLEADHLGKDQVAEGVPGAREREAETRLTLAAAWSPSPRLRFVGRVPTTSRAISAPDGRTSMTGLADPDLFAHVSVLERAGGMPSWLAVMVGIKSAWGQNGRTVAGARTDEHLQPGTGSASLFAGLAYSIASSSASHWYASAVRRWNGRNAAGYRYGDAILSTLAYQRGFSARISAGGEINYRYAERDDSARMRDPNTGGTVFYLSPKMSITLRGPLALKLGVQIPVIQRLSGDQNEHVNLQSGLVIAL
jgi:hypothetical protein